MTLLKMCGFQDPDSAVVAAEAGASFLGFVFVEGVRRQLLPDQAAQIICEYRKVMGSEGPRLVGLFANQPADFIDYVSRLCGLEYAQLCGSEPPEFWNELSIPVVRQVKVRDDLSRSDAVARAVQDVEFALDAGHLALLDKHVDGALGGTGITFDWEIAREIARDHKVLVAGGLTPENVAQAIRVARPWGVDVSSRRRNKWREGRRPDPFIRQ